MQGMRREIKSRISMTEVAFNKKNLFNRRLDLNLRKNLVMCYTWSVALYGAETWTLRKVDPKFLGSFEMWHWRRMEISWTNRVRNEEVLQRVKEERNVVQAIKRRKPDWIGHILHRNFLLGQVIKGWVEGTGRQGIRCKQLLDD
jgi:hypothetical protein